MWAYTCVHEYTCACTCVHEYTVRPFCAEQNGKGEMNECAQSVLPGLDGICAPLLTQAKHEMQDGNLSAGSSQGTRTGDFHAG